MKTEVDIIGKGREYMNKMPQYMKEFANAQRESYIDNELMKEKYKDAAVKTIENILWKVEYGFITINEGMKMLCDPLDGIIL